MDGPLPLSATIIAYNEEHRIEKCLESLQFMKEIIVVLDSRTTDNTQKICEKYGAKVFIHPFVNYGAQKNIALSKASQPWIFSIDADEVISPELKNSIQKFVRQEKSFDCAAYIIRKSFYLNRWILHGGWYPDKILRLCPKNSTQFTEPEVHEEIIHRGKTVTLSGDLIHYPFESLGHQITKNMRYAQNGAAALRKRGKKFSVTMLIVKPISKFFECYFWKLGFMDGLPGFVIAINAAYSVFMKWSFLKYENSHH